MTPPPHDGPEQYRRIGKDLERPAAGQRPGTEPYAWPESPRYLPRLSAGDRLADIVVKEGR